jgi:hypothetical protein
MCLTTINHQQFFTDCVLQKGIESHVILNGVLQYSEGKWWIKAGPDTRTFPRQVAEMKGLYNVIDACSGIGAVTQGFTACGAQIVCHIESNKAFHQWQETRSQSTCIRGCVNDPNTVYEVSKHVQESHVLTAGISCQPFSGLGDGGQGQDPRSASFTGVMMMGFFLGSLAIILECTKEANQSEWIQQQLQRFAVQTGCTVRQSILRLHETWPAQRTRWWAIIAHPALSVQSIPPMPSMRFVPSVMHLIRSMLPMSESELAQLVLSLYELRSFHDAPGGIGPNVIDVYKAMKTATHSWGSQVLACLCACRSNGFSQKRIDQKGLYAVLIPLEKEEMLGNRKVQAMRHPHPQEVALLNGLLPSHVKPSTTTPLRLELAGVGQLASPLQGAWVLSNMIFQVTQQGLHESEINPRHVHANLCRHLLQERDELWPTQGLSKSMKVFRQEVESLDTPCIFLPPDHFTHDVLSKQVPDEKMYNDDESKNQTGESDSCTTMQPTLPRPGCGGNNHAVETEQAGPSCFTYGTTCPCNTSPEIEQVSPLPRPGCGGAGHSSVALHPTKPAVSSGIMIASDSPAVINQSCPLSRPGWGGHSRASEHPPEQRITCDFFSQSPTAKQDLAKKASELQDQAEHMHQVTPVTTHVPPTLFHAKPLPRLGCGGPAPVEVGKKQEGQECQHDCPSQHDAPEQRHQSFAMPILPGNKDLAGCLDFDVEDIAGQEHHRSNRTELDEKMLHQTDAQHCPSEGGEGEHDPANLTGASDDKSKSHPNGGTNPASFNTDGNEIDMHGQNAAQRMSNPDPKNTKNAELFPSAEHTPMQSSSNDPPTLFHAMPLPRLGCGGPTQMDEESPAGTSSVRSQSNAEDTDQARFDVSQESQCRDDPYPAADPMSDDDRSTVCDHMHTAQAENKNQPHLTQSEQTVHFAGQDFYDDPEFDQEVVQALNEQAVTPFDRSVFQRGAVPGFAVKRKQQMPAGAPKYPKHGPEQMDGVQPAEQYSSEETVPANLGDPKLDENLHQLTEGIDEAGSEAVEANHEHHPPTRPDDVTNDGRVGQNGLSETERRALSDRDFCPAETIREDTCQVFVVEPGEGFFTVQVLPTHSPAHLVAATNAEINENKYGGITTIFGSPIAPDTPVKHQGWYLLQAAEPNHAESTQLSPAFPQPPVLMHKTRGRLLWDQKGWVADDEMEYYLYMIECYRPGSVFGVLHLPDRLDQHTMLTEYVLRVANAASADPDGGLKAFVILHNAHWIPVIIRVQGIMIQLLTTPQSVHWIQLMLEAVIGNEAVQFSTSAMPNAFEADCGFQAVGWILSTILDDTTSVPFSEDQAAQWRGLFYADLQYTGKII